MKEIRLRLFLNSAWDHSRRLSLIVLLPCLLFADTHMQESERRTDPLQKELLTRLTSGDEEQRLDAITRIGALWSDAPDSVEASLITALGNILQQDSSPVIRALAARALEIGGGNHANDSVAPTLIAALGKEREVAVRKAIIYALARYPQRQVTASLIPYLIDRNLELRAATAFALAESGDETSVPALTSLLERRSKDEDAFARSEAARGLGRIGGRDSIEPLLEALSRDKSQEVHREAARALGRIATRQDVNVIEALRKAALSNDPYLVAAAESALTSVNSRNL